MTGFESKRKAAQAKMNDDTQVYADTLLIVYQRGFSDGKQAAQRKPLTDERIGQIIQGCKITLVNYCSDDKQIEFARAIESAHGIKGEA